MIDDYIFRSPIEFVRRTNMTILYTLIQFMSKNLRLIPHFLEHPIQLLDEFACTVMQRQGMCYLY